jgi:hypothetical protein
MELDSAAIGLLIIILLIVGAICYVCHCPQCNQRREFSLDVIFERLIKQTNEHARQQIDG